jgi:hypothetical protein
VPFLTQSFTNSARKEQEVKEPPKVEDADNSSAAEQVPDDLDIPQ